MKVVSLVILVLLHFLNASTQTNIKCDYEFNHYDVVGSIYQCDVIGDLTIENKNEAIISTVSQNHYGIRTNEDVTGLAVNTKYIKFFPKELEKIFKNLKLIHAQNNFIQEIRQSDIKYFPELKEFNLHNNEIKMIEEGLFQFNPKLVYVSFSNNKIFFIQSDVFDRLTNLEYLYLNSNVCIDKGAYLSRSEVLNVIDYVKIDCLAPDYKTIEQTLSKLEQESTHLSATDLIAKIKNFEVELKKSSYSNFTSLNERLDKLKFIKPEELVALIPKSDSADSHEEKSSDIIFQIILVLVIAISVLIFGSILFLFLKRN